MPLEYGAGTGQDENFILRENCFDDRTLGKCESIMCQGNGYLGIRNTMEEDYLNQTRDCFVAGTFNQFDKTDVPELPNAADVIGMEMLFDGDRLDLRQWTICEYSRELNLRTGLSERKILAANENGKRIKLHFLRFISMDDLHLIAQKVYITVLDSGMEFKLSTGINGQVANSSVQHFSEGEKRLLKGRILRSIFTTTQSEIDFIFHSTVKIQDADSKIKIDRRKIWCDYSAVLKKGETFVFEKLSTIHTSRDREAFGIPADEQKDNASNHLDTLAKLGFDKLFERSAEAWREKVWKYGNVKVQSVNPFDALALRFAVYHLSVMTPVHDERMSIAAKGLSGEGYKGHVFWDAELFDVPFFIYVFPETARNLLKYRFTTLGGARKKAQAGGYLGAQYPWESTWLDDGEVTPEWCMADVVTGEPIRVESGFIEIHITAIVAYTVDRYFQATDDWAFMEEAGIQIIFETALFWASRLEYNQDKDYYEIKDVMGPDEYKEHVNNNAFTNYMAHNNMALALRYYEMLREKNPGVLKRLEHALDVNAMLEAVRARIDKVYLPQPAESGVIPQDDTYLLLKNIDLTPFKNQRHVGEILNHYNLEQVNEIQVSKQADILILLMLMESQFSPAIMRKNYDYYEARTLHDSSLSLSTHSILAKKMGDMKLAYELFERAARIDLGPDMASSDMGIHAAAMGGIWQCAVQGFAGVRPDGDILEITPVLPDAWKKLDFFYTWKGRRLHFEISREETIITSAKGTAAEKTLQLRVNGENYTLREDVLRVTSR